MLVLTAGSIVQLSQTRPDGWAFGSVIFQMQGADGSAIPLSSYSENISLDAGWFPMVCTEMPTKEALTQLAKMMGPSGADCLTPPSTWQDLKDPLVPQLFDLPD